MNTFESGGETYILSITPLFHEWGIMLRNRYIYLYAVNGCGRFGQYLIELMHQPVLSVMKSTRSSSSSTHHNPRALSVINSCSCSVIVPIESVKSNSMFSTMKCGITRKPWVMRTCYRGAGRQVYNRMMQSRHSSYLC